MSTSNNNNNNNSNNNKNYGSTAQNPTSLTTPLLSPPSTASPQTPLLPSTPSKKFSLLLHHLTQPLSPTSLSHLLLIFYFLTGILDSSAILTLGAFVSMQTGNTVYFGSGVMVPLITQMQTGGDKGNGGRVDGDRGDDGGGDKWIRAGISMGSFCLGSWGFARFHWFFAGKNKNKNGKDGEKEEIPKTRWLVLCSIFTQMVLLGIAAVVVPSTSSSSSSTTTTTNIQGNRQHQQHQQQKQLPLDLNLPVTLALTLISLQSSSQAYLSRIFGYNSLTSVVLTSIYLDLFSDPHLFSHPREGNGERFRRIAAVVCLLAGAMLGGCMVNFGLWGGLKGALWVAVGLKGVVGLGCWFWRGVVVEEEEEEGEEGEG